MFVKISFYILLQTTFLTFASQSDHTSLLFTDIQEKPSEIDPRKGMMMIVRCQTALSPSDDFFGTLHFEQNDQGMLLAVYIETQQLLGRWPDRIINTNDVLLAQNKVNPSLLQIRMPYIPIIKTPA